MEIFLANEFYVKMSEIYLKSPVCRNFKFIKFILFALLDRLIACIATFCTVEIFHFQIFHIFKSINARFGISSRDVLLSNTYLGVLGITILFEIKGDFCLVRHTSNVFCRFNCLFNINRGPF